MTHKMRPVQPSRHPEAVQQKPSAGSSRVPDRSFFMDADREDGAVRLGSAVAAAANADAHVDAPGVAGWLDASLDDEQASNAAG